MHEEEQETEPELSGVKYSDEDYQKSRNSKTASLFQKRGGLLDDPKQAEVKKEEKESKTSCWSCMFCCCRKKNQKKVHDQKQGAVKKKETENKKTGCFSCCSRKKNDKT